MFNWIKRLRVPSREEARAEGEAVVFDRLRAAGTGAGKTDGHAALLADLARHGPLNGEDERRDGPAVAEMLAADSPLIPVPREVANAAENVLNRLISTGGRDFGRYWSRTVYGARVGLSRAIEAHDKGTAAQAERLDVHAALNTYEVRDQVPCVHLLKDEFDRGVVDAVGANHRRLLIRDMPEGVWIGGALISDPEDLSHIIAALNDMRLAHTSRWVPTTSQGA